MSKEIINVIKHSCKTYLLKSNYDCEVFQNNRTV